MSRTAPEVTAKRLTMRIVCSAAEPSTQKRNAAEPQTRPEIADPTA